MTACQTYRAAHTAPVDQWPAGDIDGYLDAMDQDRARQNTEDGEEET